MATGMPTPTEQIERIRADCGTEGWDSYGADAVTDAAIEAAQSVSYTPTVNGGVQVSWNSEEVTVVFDHEGRVSGLFWDRSV